MDYNRNLLLITLIGSVLVLCAACDGSIRAKGKVYARKTAIGKSEAFVDERFPDLSQLTPVKDANVTLYHGRDYSQGPIDKTGMHDTTKTDENGAFQIYTLTAPYSFHAALVVEKEGYESLTKIFLHDKLDPHEVVVVLVPTESVPK